MSKKGKIILAVAIIAAIILVAVGYAAISNIDLNISASASGDGNSDNFRVEFTESSGDANVSTTASGLSATMMVSGLSTQGDSASATFTIKNESNGIYANISLDGTGTSDNGDFSANVSYMGTTVAPGETTTVTVTVTLNRTLINESSAAFDFKLIASPSSSGAGI